MKKIHIKGGLGNQMFQYAYGRKLLEMKKKVIFDISFFTGNKSKIDLDRPFLLNNFNISYKDKFVGLPANKFVYFLKKIIRKLGINIEEFFQSENFFSGIEDILGKEFTLREENANFVNAKSKISDYSLSIHVRHGDYLNDAKTNKYHGVVDIVYYKEAYEFLTQKTKVDQVVIFSDDPNWTKENFAFVDIPIIYASDFNLTAPEELILMSKCSHNIVANSSFSWWGAWLNQNPDKIVIAPKVWFKKGEWRHKNIIPKSWIRI